MGDMKVGAGFLTRLGLRAIVACELQWRWLMRSSERLEAERQEILREMGAIERMRRGTVNEQYIRTRQKDGGVVENGPYFLYSRTEKGRSVSQRLAEGEVVRYREETENCRRFKELANRCVLVCENLADQDEGTREKKRPRRSRSGSAR